MSIKLENNGLTLIKIKSESVTLENVIEDPIAYICEHADFNGFVVAYQDFAVWIGRYLKDGSFVFNGGRIESQYVQRIRVFNDKEELLLWRCENGFLGRQRIDDDSGDRDYAVEARQVLFGTRAKSLDNGFTELSEQRGTLLTLPFKTLEVDDGKNRVWLKTRNYINFNHSGQASYSDCRFMGFINGNKNME